jgi:ribosomal protein L37AE/L43A
MQAIKAQTRQSFRPRACLRCGGDAIFDRGGESEWRCLQCGRPLVPYSQVAVDTRRVRERTSLRPWSAWDRDVAAAIDPD